MYGFVILVTFILMFTPLNAVSETLSQKAIQETNSGLIKNYLAIRYYQKDEIFLAPGEEFEIIISTQQNAHIYCYFEDENRHVTRFFPNRFKDNSYVKNTEPLILPAGDAFEMKGSDNGISERIGCFSSHTDIIERLPSEVVGVDFEALPLKTLEEVKEIFKKISGVDISSTVFDVRIF